MLTAATRPFRLETKLRGHDLQVRSFTGEEAISKLFRFRLLVHAAFYIPTADLLGQPVTFVMELRPAQQRCFLATIASVDELGVDEHDRCLYALELVPRLWAMTQTIQARVFENLDPLGIISQVFAGSTVQVNAQVRQGDRVRRYCVQYFESDFDFAVRLLEEEGYIYLCEADGETPIFSIRHFPFSFPEIGGIAFDDSRGGPEERISSWKKTRILTATTLSARDHFFEAASPVLEGSASLPVLRTPVPGWEALRAHWPAFIHRYPGDWAHLFEGATWSDEDDAGASYMDFGGIRTRHDLHQVAGSTSASEGAGNCPRLAPGRVFQLANHPAAAGEHLVVSVRHKGSQGLDHSTHGDHSFAYKNEFTAVPHAATMVYLPPRSTRKPVIHGCQTAQVVGAPGAGEIWTDKYGRVQVKFWWDRESNNSCWIRVATPWAGSGWGMQHIPRVGQEVVVAFLDGDPDRPLIVGSVYNPLHMPPFELPGNKTQSGIRTHSTTNGGPGESNEIRFEDAKGSEEVYLHAQKDRTEVVKDESREVVGGDRYDVVQDDLHQATLGDKREIIGGKSGLTVGEDCMNDFLAKLGIRAKEIHFQAGKIVIEADSISIRTSDKHGKFIQIDSGGITIDSKGKEVWLNCEGAGTPEDGCFTGPDLPENKFKATDPTDPNFGRLKE